MMTPSPCRNCHNPGVSTYDPDAKRHFVECASLDCWQGPMMHLERDAITTWNLVMGGPERTSGGDDIEGVAIADAPCTDYQPDHEAQGDCRICGQDGLQHGEVK